MTATLPAGLEYKLIGAGVDWLPRNLETKSPGVDAPGVWGSEYPEEEGVRTQIVAVTGVRDEVGDIIVPGFFADTLRELEPKVVLGHDWNRPVGMPRAIEELMPGDPRLPKTDRFGRPWPAKAGALFARTEYMLGTKDGRDAYEHAKFFGSKLAASIGYVPDDEHTWHAIDPDTGLMTRFLGKGKLYEYGQVLHGAHPLAGGLAGLKSAEVRRVRRARPSLEFKIRLVRDAGYWGYPIGTPIRPGMRPIGPKATRTRATGQEPREDLGAVEIDANNLRIKPSGKKKWRNEAATDAAYDGLADLVADENADPFDSDSFTTVDSTAINKGEEYNPLDVLIANAVVPADLEDWLRAGDFTSLRLGDRDDVEAQGAVEGRIADVMAAYREKYNAELVRQNDTGDGEVPDPDAAPPADEGEAPAEAEATPGAGVQDVDLAELRAAIERAPDDRATARARGVRDRATTAIQRAGKLVGFDGDVFLNVGEARDTEGARLLGADMATLMDEDPDGADKASGRAIEADEIANQIEKSGADLGKAAGLVEKLRAHAEGLREAADVLIGRDQERQDQPTGSYPTDERFRAPQEEVAAQDAATGTAAPTFKPSPKLIAALEGAERGTAKISIRGVPQPDREGVIVRGHENTLYPMSRAGLAEQGRLNNRNVYVLTPEGERQLAQYLPEGVTGGSGTPSETSSDGAVAATGDMNDPASLSDEQLAAEIDAAREEMRTAPEGSDARARAKLKRDVFEDEQDRRQREGEADRPAGTPSAAEVERMAGTSAGDAAATAQAMSDEQLTAMDEALDARMEAAGKPGVVRGAHQAVKDERARREAGGPESEVDAGEAVDQDVSGDVEPEAVYPEGSAEPSEVDAGEVDAGEVGTEEGVPGGPVVDPEQAQAEANAILAADEIADTEDAADASHGIGEAPDGELEADLDVADRQDRVGSLLVQAEAGTLDLSRDRIDDDGLRVTRADLVAEIRLQDYVERRRRGERADTAAQPAVTAPGEEPSEDVPGGTGTDTTAPEIAEPRPRPGVSGAAEDYADALDDGDPERIATTRARLESSLRRSRSDSEQVAALRELLETGEPTPADLRAAAEAIRVEQRARRNESARTRRRVRRFERERLRALLGQVEAEMRGRNLDFDPLPDPDGDGTEVIPVTVTGWTEERSWASPAPTLKLDGAGYTATVDGSVNGNPVAWSWVVRDDDGNTVVTGSGHAADQEAGKAAVELALDVQRTIGALPPDAMPPAGSLPTGTSATPPSEVLAAVDTMRRRVLEGREVNPLTGVPDPLDERGPTLVPLSGPVFDGVERIRVYLEQRAIGETRLAPTVAGIRWDTVKPTPGGAFFTAERSDERGTDVYHSATGARYTHGMLKDRMGSAAGDLLRFASILERLPDDTGRVIDWSNPNGRALVDSMKEWQRGEKSGSEALNDAAIEALTAEKVRAGQWNHKLVARASDWSAGHSAVTNHVRLKQARQLSGSLGQFIDTRPRYATPDGKRTLEIVKGAATLEKLGAPDAAAVLLRRRAAELREKFGDDKARDQGVALLDRTAEAYLSAYSPVKSPGDRVMSIRPGERLYTTDEDGNARSFRVLSEPRRAYGNMVYPVVDEASGAQRYLQVGDREVSITGTPEIGSYGDTEFHSTPDNPHFLVLDRDEEPPESWEEFSARIRSEAGAIPSDVLDSAAEALPESRTETAARRATPNPTGTRPPRRNSTAAPRRKAPEPTALPAAAEENLAIAQARGLDTFYDGVVITRGEPAPGGFASMDEAAEHLRGVDAAGGQLAGSARYMLGEIEKGAVTLSPGGHFLVQKDGTIAHAGTGAKFWPAGKATTMEVTTAGFDITAGMGMSVATVFETARFDGRPLALDRDPEKTVTTVRETTGRIGVDVTLLATRAGYLNGVMEQRAIKGKDALMLRNMIRGSVPGDQTANPQALTPVGPGGVSRAYSDAWGTRTHGSGDVRYVSATKAGATLARRVMMEINLADYTGRTAPLDTVRRLSILADELEGKKIETTDGRGGSKTLVPSDDLRTVIRAVTDANDEARPSTAARLRRSGYRGTVRPEGDVEVRTAGSIWYGTAGTRTEELLNETHDAVKDGGGIRFYIDEQGRRHATFVDIDIIGTGGDRHGDPNMLPEVVPGTPSRGWIRVDDDGRLTLEFRRERRHLVVSLPPGSWSFEPEQASGGDVTEPAEEKPGNEREANEMEAEE